jgi:WD40 repeat protein/Ca2+-binding EF-hand superfamily protein
LNYESLRATDQNGDGYVTRSELQSALVDSGLPNDQAARHTNDFFNIADRFNEGRVRLSDFLCEYERMSNFKMLFYIERNMALVDSNHDNVVDKKEMLKVLEHFMGPQAARTNLDKIFRDMDTDNSGGVQFAELKRWYANTEQRVRDQQQEHFRDKKRSSSRSAPAGFLTVNITRAKNMPSLDLIGNSDPYVIITVGDVSLRTKTKAGRNVSWNEEFTFKIDADNEDMVKLMVFDYDYSSADDVIGRVDLSLSRLMRSDGKAIWYRLLDNNNMAGNYGEIELKCSFAGQGGEDQDERHTAALTSIASHKYEEKEDKTPPTLPEEDDSDVEDWQDYKRRVNPNSLENAAELMNDPDAPVEFDGGGADTKTRFLAIKPWIGQMHEPSNPPRNNPSTPGQDLELEWVYGYKSQCSYSNMCVNTEGHIIYPAAAVVVKYDARAHEQSFYIGHNDDILCLAQNPAMLDIVATGQTATIVDRRSRNPYVCIWNSRTNDSWQLPAIHKRAVRVVAFSTSGKYLASIGNDDRQKIIIWDWQNSAAVADKDTEGLPNKLFACAWRNDTEFVTAGRKHLYFWEFSYGRLRKRSASYTSECPRQTFLSVAWTSRGYCLAGGLNGDIYLLVGGKAKKKISSHSRAVFSIFVTRSDSFVTGSKDQKVVIHGADLRSERVITLEAPVQTVHVQGTRLMIGTQHAEILETSIATERKLTLLVKGHHDGELWGLDTDPNTPSFFATAGEDNKLFIWDAHNHAHFAVLPISDATGRRARRNRASSTTSEPGFRCARSVAFSPRSTHLALGLNNGDLAVFELKTLRRIVVQNLNGFSKQQVIGKTDNWIQTLKYSPQGDILAVGTHGSVVVLCDVANQYKGISALTAGSSAVTHLDWSEDSQFIQTNDLSYEILYYNINSQNLRASAHNPSSSSLKDVKWQTQTCPFGWPVQGVFDPLMDGSDINCIVRSPDQELCVTGDDFGYVNLFRYPILQKGNSRRVKEAHSSHVMNARFLADQSYVITVGGNDKCIMQWKVVSN